MQDADTTAATPPAVPRAKGWWKPIAYWIGGIYALVFLWSLVKPDASARETVVSFVPDFHVMCVDLTTLRRYVEVYRERFPQGGIGGETCSIAQFNAGSTATLVGEADRYVQLQFRNRLGEVATVWMKRSAVR